jgi:2-oxoglutarate dehydrogenase E2 component (dihydrolipoamide succinyltransferase)
MKVDIKIPEVGESVREAIIAEWLKNDGDQVEKDEPIFVIETDKVTLEVPASDSGVLEILVKEGETVEIGKVVGKIDTGGAGKEQKPVSEGEKEEDAPEDEDEEAAAPEIETAEGRDNVILPSVRRLAAEYDIDVTDIPGTGKRGQVTKEDAILYLKSGKTEAKAEPEIKPEPEEKPEKAAKPEKEAKFDKEDPAPEKGQETTRKRMSPIRKTIAAHLLSAKQNTAMLTTFNEIDMGRVKAIRDQFKDGFYEKHGVRLGFMSFFIKASVAALKEFPEVNAALEEEDIVYHHYYHIGIAIGSDKGLVVPVIRHADRLGFAQLESQIIEFAGKARKNRLSLSELEGGTFSITNGGIYGSLLSTPILNMPQSAILGMHKIEDRPVAMDGQVVIRPMMYVALSYDHRIIDGKDAVTFLRRIKEFIENPERIMMEI